MIKKTYVGLMLLLSVLLSSAACSVKEQRDDCPCRLVLDFTDVDTLALASLRVSVSDAAGPVYERSSASGDFCPEFGISVPRCEIDVNVYSGEEDCFDPGKGIVIPYGEDCPHIFMYSSSVDARCESVRDTVRMRKNHCIMDLYMDKEEDSAYELCLKGKVSGYGPDGRPVAGDFSFCPSADKGHAYRACLPRQLDSSLMLEIDDGSEVLKTFALGEYIAAGGYDWDAPDLEDLTVHIDWAMTAVTLTVSGWDWVYECEIVI